MSRVLIVGGDSTLGAACATAFAAIGATVFSTTRRSASVAPQRPYLDLATLPRSSNLPAADICVLAAGEASIVHCEQQPDRTARINVDATLSVGSDMAKQGAFVLLLSTTQVFDGSKSRHKPTDVPSPVSAYGRQKLAAEQGILSFGGQGAVLRVSKVLSPRLRLVTKWREALDAGRPVEAFEDMRFAPLNLDTATAAVLAICRQRSSGTFHASGDEDLTYVDLAAAVTAALGADPASVRRLRAAGRMPAILLPEHTALDCGELEGLGWKQEPSRAALSRYVASLHIGPVSAQR